MADGATTVSKCSACPVHVDRLTGTVYSSKSSVTGPETEKATSSNPIDELEGTDKPDSENVTLPETSTSTTWSYTATMLLITTVKDLQHMFTSSACRKVDAWKEVARKMEAEGYHYTGEQCDKKMRGLRYRNKLITEGNQKTGNDRRTWKYFKAMENLQAGDPSVRPVRKASSLTLNKASKSILGVQLTASAETTTPDKIGYSNVDRGDVNLPQSFTSPSKCSVSVPASAKATSSEATDELGTDNIDSKDMNLPDASTSTVTWGYSAIMLLIATVKDLQSMFISSAYRKADAWKQVARKMEAEGYHYTAEQCDKKMRGLRYRHKLGGNGNRKTGNGRKTWKYFEAMEDLQAGCSSVRLTRRASSPPLNPDKQSSSEKQPMTSWTQSHQSPSQKTTTSSSGHRQLSPEQPSGENTQRRTQRKRKNEEDLLSWFQTHLQELIQQQTIANDVAKERNDILKSLVDKLTKK